MPRAPRPRTDRLRTEALLVRSVPFGDADLMVTLFTEARGVLSAFARSARRSRRRFPALEPMHLLRVGLEERPGGDVAVLVESALVRPRLGLVGDLDRLEAAGRALRWVRRAAPPHTAEPALWQEINALLDRLDGLAAMPGGPTPGALVAGMGLRLLAAVGWGLDLARCVRCGKACEPGASAYLDAGEGGLVCRGCGGARQLLRGERRERLLAAARGEEAALDAEDARLAFELVDAALAAHT
jgi:DNA repair protein RecO (recombination protein O)